MGLQEWIHKLEEGEGAVYIKRLFLFLALAGLAAAYNVREFKNFSNPEAMDSAQIARNIANGEGYTTKMVRPLSIKLMQLHQGEAVDPFKGGFPELSHAPMYPLLQAAVMKILPFKYNIADGATFMRYQPEVLLAGFNQFLFAALLLSLFFLARRLFDLGVALTTVGALALTELFWRYSVSGLPTIFLALVTVWLVSCLTSIEQRIREGTATDKWVIGMSVAVGLLFAIGAMTRYSYAWLALPTIGYAAATFGPKRGVTITAALVFLALAWGPWCFRNYTISGRIFGTAGFAAMEGTQYFPKDRWQRSMSQNMDFDLNKVTMDQYTKKFLVGVGESLRNEVPKMGGSWLSALFLAGLLAPFRNPGLRRLRYFLIGSIALFICVQSLGRTYISEMSPEVNSESLLILLAPLAFMFGVALFYTILDQIPFEMPQYRTAAVAAFVVVMSLPLIFTFLPPRSFPVAYPPYYPPYIKQIGNWTKPDELLMSDMPWAMAWYGDRTCVWTTLDTGGSLPSDFFAIHDHIKPVKLLCLSPITLDVKFVSDMLKGSESAWSRFALDGMMRTNVPAGFPLKYSPGGYLPDFLILTDRKRW
jgi:hypothetical protein